MPLELVQVGAGKWGRSWAELVHRSAGFKLAALVDDADAVRDWATQELGVPTFRSLGEALAAVETRGVLLVSPPSTHRAQSEEALAAGRHVLSEKPFALRLEDALAVVQAAKRARRYVMVAQNYRFRRQSRALQALVSTGELGRLLGIRIACRRDLRNAWISPHDWRGRMESPYLVDMAIHHVDMLRQITGREIRQVDARAWRVPDSPFRGEPTVEAVLTLDDGTPVAYEGTWAAPGPETSWNGDWELVGERARATWTGGVQHALRSTVTLERYGSPRQRVALPLVPALDRLGTLHEFRRAIAQGTPPETSLEDNLSSLRAVFALARSASTGKPVRP